MAARKKATPRVMEHVDRLREAGLDTQRFFDALVSIRDDTALPRAHRDAIYKLIAQESFVWYLEALRDEPIDRVKLAAQVNELGAEYDVAIRKQGGGEKAEALAERDIGVDPAGAGPGAARDHRPTRPSGTLRAPLADPADAGAKGAGDHRPTRPSGTLRAPLADPAGPRGAREIAAEAPGPAPARGLGSAPPSGPRAAPRGAPRSGGPRPRARSGPNPAARPPPTGRKA
jgi:hypothetical protein